MLSATLLSGVALTGLATFSPVSALEVSESELEKMFTVLIHDEYKAQAEYAALIQEFGAVYNPNLFYYRSSYSLIILTFGKSPRQ